MNVTPSLQNSLLVKRLARLSAANEANAKFVGLPKGTVRARVVDVEDPKEMGRVRVIFDAMNYKDIPQVEGTSEEYIAERVGEGFELSHWIDTSPAFVGKQPKGLIGKRVNISLSNGQYQYAILQDVVNDPQVLTPTAAGELEPPNNSSMTRLPCYEADELPPPSEENRGCTIIELNGPQGDDWLMVCLLRGGEYKWVRHIDRLHFHTGQLPDNDSESNGPDQEARTYDSVINTTGEGSGEAPTEALD